MNVIRKNQYNGQFNNYCVYYLHVTHISTQQQNRLKWTLRIEIHNCREEIFSFWMREAQIKMGFWMFTYLRIFVYIAILSVEFIRNGVQYYQEMIYLPIMKIIIWRKSWNLAEIKWFVPDDIIQKIISFRCNTDCSIYLLVIGTISMNPLVKPFL